ncbi:MAG: hypothetical protein AAFX96_00615, partial [Pseudomonadota bacterium]
SMAGSSVKSFTPMPERAAAQSRVSAIPGMGVNDLTDDPAMLQASLVCLLKTQVDQSSVPIEVTQRLAGKAA